MLTILEALGWTMGTNERGVVATPVIPVLWRVRSSRSPSVTPKFQTSLAYVRWKSHKTRSPAHGVAGELTESRSLYKTGSVNCDSGGSERFSWLLMATGDGEVILLNGVGPGQLLNIPVIVSHPC